MAAPTAAIKMGCLTVHAIEGLPSEKYIPNNNAPSNTLGEGNNFCISRLVKRYREEQYLCSHVSSIMALLRIGREETELDALEPTPFGLRDAHTKVLQSKKDKQGEKSLQRIENVKHEREKKPPLGFHHELFSDPRHHAPDGCKQGRRNVEQTLDRRNSAGFDAGAGPAASVH